MEEWEPRLLYTARLFWSTWQLKFWSWLETLPKIWKSNVSPLAIYNSLFAVTKSWTVSSKRPLLEEVSSPTSTSLSLERRVGQHQANLAASPKFYLQVDLSRGRKKVIQPPQVWVPCQLLRARKGTSPSMKGSTSPYASGIHHDNVLNMILTFSPSFLRHHTRIASGLPRRN